MFCGGLWCGLWWFVVFSATFANSLDPDQDRQNVGPDLTSGDFCCLLITFANSLDPDQDRQIVGPDLDPNRLTLW